MKRIYLFYSKIIALLLFSTIFVVSTSDAQIVCNKFKLVKKITGSTLDLSLDTDLPENIKIWVSVSRSYYEKGNLSRYSVDYLSNLSTVGEWRSSHKVSIDSDKWKSELRKKQEKMSGYGAGFDVASISEKIDISIILTGSQEDKITGKAVKVRNNGSRYIEDKIEIDYPLDSPPVGKSPFPSLNPEELDVGQTYIVSKETPLMPSHSPDYPISALQKMKQIPKSGAFKVLDTFNKRGNPWYRVVAFDKKKKKIGTGWINSTALLGQKLKAFN